MERGLEVEQNRVRAELLRHVGTVGLFDVRKFAKELPTHLNRLLEDHLVIISQTFEVEVRGACEKLQADYPALGIQEDTGVILRRKTGIELLTGAVGGVALTATGVGLVSAASATAASIAAANAVALAATTTVAAPSLLTAWLTASGVGCACPRLGRDRNGGCASSHHNHATLGRSGRAGGLDTRGNRGASSPVLLASLQDQAKRQPRGRVHRANRPSLPAYQEGSDSGASQDGSDHRGRIRYQARQADCRPRGGNREGFEEIDTQFEGQLSRVTGRSGSSDSPPRPITGVTGHQHKLAT